MPCVFVFLCIYTCVVLYQSSVSLCTRRTWHYKEMKVFRLSRIPLSRLPRRSRSQQTFLPRQNQTTFSSDHMTHVKHLSMNHLHSTYECSCSVSMLNLHSGDSLTARTQRFTCSAATCHSAVLSVCWLTCKAEMLKECNRNKKCMNLVGMHIDSFCYICAFWFWTNKELC